MFFDVNDVIDVSNARSLEDWMAYAGKLEKQIKQLRTNNNLLTAENTQLQAEVERLRLNQAINQADIAGLLKQRDLLGGEIKACPSEHPSIVTGPDGQSPATRLYNETFDTEARAHGIPNPEQYR